jgi:hypothetical protein
MATVDIAIEYCNTSLPEAKVSCCVEREYPWHCVCCMADVKAGEM